MLAHRSEFEEVFVTGLDSRSDIGPIRSIDALDSAPDPSLDHYCKRMRSEVAQGDELSIRAAALSLEMDIRVLKYDPSRDSIMILTYPGTPITNGPEESLQEKGPMGSLESNVNRGNSLTIAHYASQYGGAGPLQLDPPS